MYLNGVCDDLYGNRKACENYNCNYFFSLRSIRINTVCFLPLCVLDLLIWHAHGTALMVTQSRVQGGYIVQRTKDFSR